MRTNILACGPSGANWDGKGYCIGVNDCLKFGKPVNALVVVNWNFEPQREAIIRNTKTPDGFYTNNEAYWHGQQNVKVLTLKKFRPRIFNENKVWHSNTSPFIAISLAATLGYKEIVLWGVDFTDHPIVNGSLLEREVEQYLSLATLLWNKKIKVFLGTDSGYFSGLLPCLQP